MTSPVVPGGCILLARKIIDSEIWKKPPLYLKVWVYFLTRAQHKDYKSLKKGQLITSIPEIIDDVSWSVGARTEKPTKDQIFQIIEWMRKASAKATQVGYESNAKATTKATMIATTKATHKILININNYAEYQDFKNYESNAEGNDESNDEKATGEPGSAFTPNNINKNVSTNKNEQDIKTSSRQQKTYAEDSSPYRMAVYLHDKIMAFAEGIGKAHLVREANMQKWADSCRKILELDNRDREEAKAVIDWATSDTFWQQNILSPDKLRVKYTELCLKMGTQGKKGNGLQNPNDKHFEKNKIEAQKIMEAKERERVGVKRSLLEDREPLQ